MPTKRGPKPPTDTTPLPFAATGDDVVDFTLFCEKYIRVEGSTPMLLRPWQIQIVEMVWAGQRPKLAALSIGRGNSKSTLLAGMCLYLLFLREDFSIDLLAFDERQAGQIGRICAKMIARHPQLEKRATIYRDRIVVGDSELCWLPAIPAALEGRLPDFVCVDEGGRVAREVFEVASFSVSKKAHAQLFLIGTPGPGDNVLAQFRDYCHNHPEDHTQRYMEFSADQWRDHPLDCDHCLLAANPALGDWLDRASVLATLPPKMTENHWRRVRLVQFWATGADDPFISPAVWDSLTSTRAIPDRTDVVLALDGSHSRDCTALLVGTVEKVPHFDVVKVWSNPGSEDWRVDVLAVEDEIRHACQRWNVKEAVADPFRWNRSLQVLAAEGIPVREFPFSPSRVTKATTDLHSALVNGSLTHSGDATLRAHVLAATVIESDGGLKLAKVSRSRNAPRIDCAAALLCGYSRCSWLASRKPARRRVIGI